jgi:hypothetical protein
MGVAAPVYRRRHRLRGRPGALSRLIPLAGACAVLVALSLAPVALAQPAGAVVAGTPGLGLLPSVLPTVCVGGALLCPGSVVALPTAPPVPVPSACVGSLCVVTTRSPPATSPPVGASPPPTARPSAGATGTPAPAVAQPGPTGGTGQAVAVLPAPPGVGLVPPARAVVDDGLNPDAFATVLSLSLRDGLAAGGNHVWPWLLGIQLVLWTAIALVSWSRQLSSKPDPRG